MQALLTSPRIIDFVLLLTLLEAGALIMLRHWRGHGLRPGAIIGTLLPGICLMLGLRAVLAGATWPWVPMALFASLVTHLLDLSLRDRV